MPRSVNSAKKLARHASSPKEAASKRSTSPKTPATHNQQSAQTQTKGHKSRRRAQTVSHSAREGLPLAYCQPASFRSAAPNPEPVERGLHRSGSGRFAIEPQQRFGATETHHQPAVITETELKAIDVWQLTTSKPTIAVGAWFCRAWSTRSRACISARGKSMRS